MERWPEGLKLERYFQLVSQSWDLKEIKESFDDETEAIFVGIERSSGNAIDDLDWDGEDPVRIALLFIWRLPTEGDIDDGYDPKKEILTVEIANGGLSWDVLPYFIDVIEKLSALSLYPTPLDVMILLTECGIEDATMPHPMPKPGECACGCGKTKGLVEYGQVEKVMVCRKYKKELDQANKELRKLIEESKKKKRKSN